MTYQKRLIKTPLLEWNKKERVNPKILAKHLSEEGSLRHEKQSFTINNDGNIQFFEDFFPYKNEQKQNLAKKGEELKEFVFVCLFF